MTDLTPQTVSAFGAQTVHSFSPTSTSTEAEVEASARRIALTVTAHLTASAGNPGRPVAQITREGALLTRAQADAVITELQARLATHVEPKPRRTR